jgi:predicted acetyltransferase
MFEIHEPAEVDREAVALVAGLSFNSRAHGEDVVLRRSLCAFDAGRVTAVARVIPLGQWFGGERLACAGIAGVAVLPEYRGRGVARELVRELLTRERARDVVVSALYPANAGLYRQLGYEYAGLRPQFRASVADLPPGKGQVRELANDELDMVIKCFSRYASAHNGPVEVLEPGYWADLVLGKRGDGTYPRTVVVPGDNGIVGYASYYLENRVGEDYRLACRHLVALNATALSSLLGYFRRFQNAAKDLSWHGPPSMGPVGLSLQSNGFSIVPLVSRWMMRILDVQQAVEARGYPEVDGEAVIAVDDPLFPENAGPWTLSAASGKVKVSPAPRARAKPVPIGLLSALYSGFATARDLVLLGGLEEDEPALGLLSDLFSGPVPWMPDAF